MNFLELRFVLSDTGSPWRKRIFWYTRFIWKQGKHVRNKTARILYIRKTSNSVKFLDLSVVGLSHKGLYFKYANSATSTQELANILSNPKRALDSQGNRFGGYTIRRVHYSQGTRFGGYTIRRVHDLKGTRFAEYMKLEFNPRQL
jgi:hypothetical protein